MRSLTDLDTSRQISGVTYLKLAELLFVSLLLVYTYPFAFQISGVDPTLPIDDQEVGKLVYYLQFAIPLLCIAIAAAYHGDLSFGIPGVILVYPLLCLASTAWSVDPYNTFKSTSVLIMFVLATGAICSVLDIDVYCNAVIKVLIFLILSSVVMAIAFPKYGTHQVGDVFEDIRVGVWRGVFVHKNGLGEAAALSVFTFFCFRRLLAAPVALWVTYMAAAIACLVFASSAGAFVTVGALLLCYWLVRATAGQTTLPFLVLLIIATTLIFCMVFHFFSDDLVGLVGRDMTFSGRTDIWSIGLNAARQRPILGFGYSAQTIDPLKPLVAMKVNVHNGYLNVLIVTGIVGLVSLLTWFLIVITRGIHRPNTSTSCERDYFMLLAFFPIGSLFFSFVEVVMDDPRTLAGALTFSSLTAIPCYLRASLISPGRRLFRTQPNHLASNDRPSRTDACNTATPCPRRSRWRG
jgi:exopolysaccharide production protein ExoQ